MNSEISVPISGLDVKIRLLASEDGNLVAVPGTFTDARKVPIPVILHMSSTMDDESNDLLDEIVMSSGANKILTGTTLKVDGILSIFGYADDSKVTLNAIIRCSQIRFEGAVYAYDSRGIVLMSQYQVGKTKFLESAYGTPPRKSTEEDGEEEAPSDSE